MATYLYHIVTDSEEDLIATLSLTDGSSYVMQNRSDITSIFLEERVTGTTRLGPGVDLNAGQFAQYDVEAATPMHVWCPQGQNATLVVSPL